MYSGQKQMNAKGTEKKIHHSLAEASKEEITWARSSQALAIRIGYCIGFTIFMDIGLPNV